MQLIYYTSINSLWFIIITYSTDKFSEFFIAIKTIARICKIIPGQNLPCPEHGTLWANSGIVQANPGRLTTLMFTRRLVGLVTVLGDEQSWIVCALLSCRSS